ncbi:K(lysine) acetyltransferase [Dimargaris verticillata]|uniref:histone acetyltransferase n=1 Tax=Dimargaris verticillata TaxID=2761393 RepID=A0A9W8B526_9FUNG|nr:K(lysine) acetyltransferase [Dimargaris verticillata]
MARRNHGGPTSAPSGTPSPATPAATPGRQREIVWGSAYQLTTWYASAYPAEYDSAEVLHICDRCFKYMRKEATLHRHLAECQQLTPPGLELYSDHGQPSQPTKQLHQPRLQSLRIFEVDGKAHKLYGQNLALFGKLFLENKTVSYDIDRFYFYVLTRTFTSDGVTAVQVLGYFSKEKASLEQHNLACIVVFPPFQGQGHGQLLIDLSYTLTRREGGSGTPERPLSAQAERSYRTYWQKAVLSALHEHSREYYALDRLCRQTGMTGDDVMTTLYRLGLVQHWHSQAVLCIPKDDLQQRIDRVNISRFPILKPRALRDWTWDSVSP